MANPVNRTLIVCSVSALALAIATLCYWKLRKRRLLYSPNSSSSNGSCQQSSYSEQTSPTTTTSSLSGDDSIDCSTKAIPPSSDIDSVSNESIASSSTSHSFLLVEAPESGSDIIAQQDPVKTIDPVTVEKPTFADIIRRDVTTSVNEPLTHVGDSHIQTNIIANNKEEESIEGGRSESSTQDETHDNETDDIGTFQDNEDDLRESEEADSLRVEVSSVCSSILSRDVIDDSITGEEDTELGVEKVAEILSHNNNFEHQVQEAVQAGIIKLNTVHSFENDKAAEDISKLLSEMHINNENGGTALSHENQADTDAKQNNIENNKTSSNNSPVKPEPEKKMESPTPEEKNNDNQNIVKKSSKNNTESSALANKQSSAATKAAALKPQSAAPTVNGCTSSKAGSEQRSTKSPSSSSASSSSTPNSDKDSKDFNDGKKKDAKIFNNRRPNQTFAQVVSSKASPNNNGSKAQVNGTRSPQQPQQSVEMSIDAYQNYPDSPALNSQCSPMSEISDQQSLHSSDSGAGSDTNPTTFSTKTATSDDPNAVAGLAASLPPSGAATEQICYQFDVPTELCGRLIGTRGHMINLIKNKSQTECVINRSPFHPDTIRSCSIVGLPDNVNYALTLIRQRFPIEKYPTMTLIQTNVIPVPTLELNNSCNLNLLPEIMNDAVLSCTINPGHIFVQLPTHPTHPNLQQLDYLMNVNYSQPNVPGVPSAVPGMVCVAQNGNNWFRTIIKSVSESGHECEVVFVDYGGFAILPVSALKQIKLEFLNLPFQACECYLYNIAPIDDAEDWSADALQYFFEEMSNKLIYVRVIELAQDQIPYVQLFKRLENNQTLCMNTELVNRGYAKWMDESLAFK